MAEPGSCAKLMPGMAVKAFAEACTMAMAALASTTGPGPFAASAFGAVLASTAGPLAATACTAAVPFGSAFAEAFTVAFLPGGHIFAKNAGLRSAVSAASRASGWARRSTAIAELQDFARLQAHRILLGAKETHKHKDRTNHDFWYPASIGPWSQKVMPMQFLGRP